MLDPVVDIAWLKDRRAAVVVADVRWYADGRSGRREYEAGHIPGAVFVDLDSVLAGDPSVGHGRHPLPSPERFATAMSELGIADDTLVVAYDDEGGVIAARLVWMLRVTRHDAAILDGGLQAYSGVLETSEPVLRRAIFTARPWPPEVLAGPADLSDPSIVLIDARNADRFRGEFEPIDAKAGHIPGARNLPCRESLDHKGGLLPDEVLRQRFEEVGALPGTVVVSYCGSGVTACHNLLVLEHLGIGGGRLYPGSWSEYSSIAENPVQTGERT
jgi:thiosulfate/3-mercaptopyruvate sulfurtransferase